MIGVFGARLRSPLRWLSGVMSSLMVVFLSSVLEAPALMIAAPFTGAVFLLAPAVGIFSHDEAIVERAGVRLEAYEVSDGAQTDPGSTRFRVVLVNDADVAAEGFRIRLLIPGDIAPAASRTRPLGTLLTGSFGSHWFLDSMLDATAITFRTTPHNGAHAITCPRRSRQKLADLVLPAQLRPFDLHFDYHVSGGNVKATLGQLHVRSEG
jgi:hypothetical protein